MPYPALPKAFSRLAVLALPFATVLMLSTGAASAQDAAPAEATAAEAPAQPQPGDVVATVGGHEITEADLAFAAEDLAQDLQQIPANERRAFLLSVLIDMRVMADAAEAEGYADDEMFQRRMDYLRASALRGAFFANLVQPSVTDEEIQETYDTAIAGFEPQEEVRARHILVETEEEATDIIAEIEGGMSFEQAAMAYSSDGSAANGGDLGYFSRGMMVAPFEEAAFALEVGGLSAPVESQFGWHLIKLEDRRESAPPPLDQVRDQVAQQVLYTNFAQMVEDLKAGIEIDIPDADLAAQVQAQTEL